MFLLIPIVLFFSATFLTHAIEKFEVNDSTSNKEAKLYFDFMTLLFQEFQGSNGNFSITYDNAKDVASWFMK